MSSQFDVVVAGAGPAGLLFARNLALAGFRVALLERDNAESLGKTIVVDVERSIFPRVELAAPKGEEIAFEPSGERIFSPREKQILAKRGLPSTYSIRLDIFVKRLLDEALATGAEWFGEHEALRPLLEGERVVGLRWRSSKQEGELRAPITVDATGYAASLVRRMPEALGWFWRDEERDRVVAANHLHRVRKEEAREALSQRRQGDNEVWIRLSAHGNYSTEYSFLSLNADKAYILIGLRAGTDEGLLARLIDDFRESRGYFGERLYGGEGSIRVRRSLDRLVGHGFMVLGEAACQVIPINGSGVASALYAGSLAAETASEALREGETSAEALWSYAAAYQTGRGRLLAAYDAFKSVIESLPHERVRAILEGGLLSKEDLEPPEEMRLAVPGVGELLRKGTRLLRRPRLIGPVASIFREVCAAGGHYASYPRSFEPEAMDSWRRTASELMERAREAGGAT